MFVGVLATPLDILSSLQTHHVYSTCNTRGVFVGKFDFVLKIKVNKNCLKSLLLYLLEFLISFKVFELQKRVILSMMQQTENSFQNALTLEW